MSRFQYTNRNLELLEPYEWKRSRTVLRGESGSNAADLPDRPSDLAQRDGRAIRKGNEVAKTFAGDKVDIIIYAVEKSLDSYKFNLLQNKQTFINQLKTNTLGSRTIDEGSMDEGGGMNFSEYVAILSGNTDLLEKAKLEKKINALESERRSFEKGKSSAIYKLEDSTRQLDSNREFISRITQDWDIFTSRVQKDREGNYLNPIKLDNFDSIDPKIIGKKLNEIADNARTNMEYFNIGELYGFKIAVKSEPSQKEGVLFNDNRFFIIGDSGVKYNYNNGHLAIEPLTASKNFINALDKIPSIIEQYQEKNKKIEADIPVLKEVVESSWKKEPELKGLKSELAALERQIQLTLNSKPDTINGEIIGKEEAKLHQRQPDRKEYSEDWQPPKIEVPPVPIYHTGKPVTIRIKEEMQKIKEQRDIVAVKDIASSSGSTYNIRSSQPQSIKEILASADSRLIIAGIGQQNKTAEPIKEESAIQQPMQQSRRFKL